MTDPQRISGTLLRFARAKSPARGMRGALAYALLLGLVGAGIVHIVVLLLVPEFSERNASVRLAAVSGLDQVTHIDPVGAVPMLGTPDPAFQMAACRFDLSSGPVHVATPGKAPFWSASIYDSGGRNLYSLNDRSGAGDVLDFVVLTPEQMIGVRQDLPEAFTQSVFVEVPAEDGILVVRAFAPDESWKPAVSQFFARMTCATR
ncbi:DUF1254 domain-containing protein [Mesorhizobium sp. IMUNJ 23232]|uniref:DUF1254 domain-containing protein n=1 Tax=Mesorhizobium sp. IMUNJ 23232 TaxID=3376064 RepID=UPI0037B446FC